jgi:hypothetical protein
LLNSLNLRENNQLSKVKTFLINHTDLPVGVISQLVKGRDPRHGRQTFFWEMGLVGETGPNGKDLFMYTTLSGPIHKYVNTAPARQQREPTTTSSPVTQTLWSKFIKALQPLELPPRQQHIELMQSSNKQLPTQQLQQITQRTQITPDTIL